MNIIQVQYPNDIEKRRYTFKVPDGITIRKNDVIRVRNRSGKEEIGIAVTDSVDVSDNIVDMIMSGKKVISSVVGKYEYQPYACNKVAVYAFDKHGNKVAAFYPYECNRQER